MTLDEITFEHIAALYEKHGLRPAPYSPEVTRTGGCCLLGVLGYDLTGEHEGTTTVRLDDLGISYENGWQLACGFDLGIRNVRLLQRVQDPWTTRGYEIGRAFYDKQRIRP